jgi:hypothetical protein
MLLSLGHKGPCTSLVQGVLMSTLLLVSILELTIFFSFLFPTQHLLDELIQP